MTKKSYDTKYIEWSLNGFWIEHKTVIKDIMGTTVD